jgi:hypothetical protein
LGSRERVLEREDEEPAMDGDRRVRVRRCSRVSGVDQAPASDLAGIEGIVDRPSK